MDTNIVETSPSENNSQPVLPEPQSTNYLDFFKSTLLQSADIWNSIKRDITEVAQSVATSDSLSAAKGTASSVYRQFSDVVQSLNQEGAKAEPLPEEPTPSLDYPPEEFDFSSQFSHLKSSFTSIVNVLEKGISELTGGNFNFNLGPSENTTSSDNREVRIEVIRADSATFEQAPSTTQKDILSYSAWRGAYYDENTCCPHPGIPVFEGESIPEKSSVNATTTYSPPAQILEDSPIVRSHLLRLVDPDGGNNGGIQESDFWSRYYYRVWCLDVLELRRSRLSRINAGVDLRQSEKEALDSAVAWPELEEEGVKKEEESNTNAESSTVVRKEPKEKLEKNEGSQLAPKETETMLSSPASSVVLVTGEDMAESSEDDRIDGDERNLTHQEPRDTQETEDCEDVIQLTTKFLKKEAGKMEKELAELKGDDEDGKSDANMHPYGRINLSTPTGSNSGAPKRSAIPIGDENKPISPYFSRLFASPSVRSSNSSYFSPTSTSLSNRTSVYNRELPPSLFNFQSPFRRPIQSPSQLGPSRPRTATEFLRSATSSVIDRAIQKLEYNNRKRPCESLTDDIDENASINDSFISKRYRGCYEDNNNSQNVVNSSEHVETTLPRPRLKPTSSSSLHRPSSAKLPQQVSRLSSAALEAIAFAATKRQRPSDNLDDESINVSENDDLALAPPAPKRRATRDCETQTVFQVDSSTSTRESSPGVPEKLPKRRPPNMTSVSQLFMRLEAKARASSSSLRLAALRRIGGGLPTSSLEDRQAHIRRFFEEITDKDGPKFGDGHKSLSSSSDNALTSSVIVSSSPATSAISTQPPKSTQPSVLLNSQATSKPSTATVVTMSPLPFSFGNTPTSSEAPTVSSAAVLPSTSSLSTISSVKTSLPEKTSNSSSSSLSVASSGVSTFTTSFSLGKTAVAENTPAGSLESTASLILPSFSFEKTTSAVEKSLPTTANTSTSNLSVPPPNASMASSGVTLPSISFGKTATAVEKTTSESTTSGAPSFSFSFGAGATAKSTTGNTSSPGAGGFNFSLPKTTSNAQELSARPPTSSTGLGFSFTPKSSTVVASSVETPKFVFGQASPASISAAISTSSGFAVPTFNFTPISATKSSTAPCFTFIAASSNATTKSTTPNSSFSLTATESQKTSEHVSTTSSGPLFSFSGNPSTAGTTTKSGGLNFSGNLAVYATTNTSVGALSTAPTFNFSAIASQKPGTTSTISSTPSFNFSATAGSSSPFSLPKTAGTTVPPPAFNFSLKPSTASTTSTLPGFNFSASTATIAPSALFSGMSSTAPSTTAAVLGASGFNFPTSKTTTAPSVPSFSFPSATTTTTSSSSLFGFSTSQPLTTLTTGGFSFSGATTTSSANPFSGFSASSQNPTPTAPSTFGFGSATNLSSPFALNKTGLSNGTSASPFGGTQNAVTTTASSNPFGFSGTNATATTTTTTSGLGFPASSLFKFGASAQNAPATSTTQSGFSLNLPTIKSSPSIFSSGEAAKRPGNSAFTNTDAISTPTKIGFGGFSASNPTPFGAAPAFNFGGANPTGGFNFNATSAVGGFNFGTSTANPPVFGGSSQASSNPFSAQPTTPNAAASFAQRRRQLRTTRRR